MKPEDLAVFEAKVAALDNFEGWPNKSQATDVALMFFDAGLAHRDAQPAGAQGEAVGHQYQSRDRTWNNFIDQKHYENTLADGTWPIRAIYTKPPAVAVNEQDGVDAARYRWLFGARTEAECADENVGFAPPKDQDFVIGKISTVFADKATVDAWVDAAIAEAEKTKGGV